MPTKTKQRKAIQRGSSNYYKPRSYRSRERSSGVYKKLFGQLLAIAAILALLWFGGIAVLSSLDNFWNVLGLGGASEAVNTQNEDKIPPTAPRLNSHPEATNQSPITITGFAEAQSKIKLVRNDVEVGQTFSNPEGSFKFKDIHLEEGLNTFIATSTDDSGNESPASSSLRINFNKQAPKIIVEKPTSGDKFSGSKADGATVEIAGTVENANEVLVNGTRSILDDQGAFSIFITLTEEGENKIKIEAISDAGNKTEQEISVQIELTDED